MRPRAPLLLVLLAALPAVLPSCTEHVPAPRSATLARISRGPHAVEATTDGLVFYDASTALLRLPLSHLSFGVVPELADGLAYDPYWLEYSPSGGAPEPPGDLAWESPGRLSLASRTDAEIVLSTTLPHGKAGLTVRAEADGRFSVTVTPEESGAKIAYLRIGARASASEGFYGLGEWPDAVNHRGKLRPMQIETDPDLESRYNENHVPIPLLIGTRGWGIFVASKRVGLFDVARKEPDLVETTWAVAGADRPDAWKMYLLGASEPIDVTRLYYDVTGYPRVPAPWGFGPVFWRNESKDQDEVLSDIATLRSLDLATTGLWIDRPYATAVNTFDFDAKRFPDPKRMIDAAHDAGLRVALWHTPYLEPSARPLRGEAESKGYFVPKPSISLNSWSTPIDFTNPAATRFWQDNLGRYTTLGVEGWKLDFAEDVAPSLRGNRNKWGFSDGSDERTMHHGYTVLYHRTYQEVLPPDGSFMLCRAGRWGDQVNVSVIWPGDMDASFARHREKRRLPSGEEIVSVGGLPATVIQAIGLGPSGFPFFGADTGGYRHGPPDRELYIRWFEQTALSSVMQVGDSSSQPPWLFTASNGRDQAALDLYRAYARLHLRLLPYLHTHAMNVRRGGRPLMRPLGLAYPALGVHPDDAYLLGDALLVSPVVDRGQTSREVIFPDGEWASWWDASVHAGATTGARERIAAPLDRIPLFVRKGGIVPLLRPTIDTLSPVRSPKDIDALATDKGSLYVRAFPDPARASTFVIEGGGTITIAPEGSNLAIAHEGWSASPAVFELVLAAKPRGVSRPGAGAIAEVASVTALDGVAAGWTWTGQGMAVVKAASGRVIVER